MIEFCYSGVEHKKRVLYTEEAAQIDLKGGGESISNIDSSVRVFVSFFL